MLAGLFDSDRRRWTRFAAAVALYAVLGTAALIFTPIVRPTPFHYETRADKLAGRPYATSHARVLETHDGYFLVKTKRGPDLRFTDPAHMATAAQPAPSPVSKDVRLCGVTVERGAMLRLSGTFQPPNLLVCSRIAPNPAWWEKYATGVPAILLAGWLLWRGVRMTRSGLLLDRRGRREAR